MFLSKIQSQKLVTLVVESQSLTAFVWHNTAVIHTFNYVFEAHEIHELTIFNMTALVKLLKGWFKEARLSLDTPVIVLVDSPGLEEQFFSKESGNVQEVHEQLKNNTCSSLTLENGFYCAKLADYKRTQYHLWALQTPFTLVGIQTVSLVYYYAAQSTNYASDFVPQNFLEWRIGLQESCLQKNHSQLYWYEIGIRCLIERFLKLIF